MKQILLSQGKFAMVDDADFIILNQYKWYAHLRRGIYYAARNSKPINGKRVQIQMHRQIMKVNDPIVVVDHRDHNTLNNQRSNLRVCTQKENTANKTSRRNSSSRFLGVSYSKTQKRWIVMIMKDGKNIRVGAFDFEEEAASAYNRAAINYHGEFANLNNVNNL